MKKAGIVGSGTMGTSIAQVFAAAGYETVLADISMELAQNGKEKICGNLKRMLQKNRITEEEAEAVSGRITPVDSLEQCAGCNIVVEAVAERMDIKRGIFSSLEDAVDRETILVTNTSSLSITEIGGALKRKERFMGMHFFNPATAMKLVEVISGENTDPKYTEQTIRIIKEIGKTPVKAMESAGFIVNRILIPMINEGIAVYAEGVASAEDIDTAMKLGANHPMGPLALGDLIGLDIVLDIMEVLQSETGDDKYRPHPLLRKMVRAGKLGKKAGIGFFQYQEGKGKE